MLQFGAQYGTRKNKQHLLRNLQLEKRRIDKISMLDESTKIGGLQNVWRVWNMSGMCPRTLHKFGVEHIPGNIPEPNRMIPVKEGNLCKQLLLDIRVGNGGA